ncbi:MAG: CopG family transcriptional regulator [Candidatus Solibacter sp.]
MRTTIDLDKDLLAAARQLARQRGITLGECISELALKSLKEVAPPKFRNGLLLLTPVPGAPRTGLDLVNAKRDEEGA